MKILITNDDGIAAEGLALLVKWAVTRGDVTVVAPTTEQSGKSQAIDFIHPVEIRQVPYPGGVTAYAMASTPADCVRFGIVGLGQTYDLVLSGLNRGENVGHDIVYSGTVGAIYEAAMHGVPAIALSTFRDTQAEAARHFDEVLDFVLDSGILADTFLLNVNIPASPIGIRVTRQGDLYYSDAFVQQGEDLYIQIGQPVPDADPEDLDRDTVALRNGYVSVTPLATTRTDMAVFERYHGLFSFKNQGCRK